MILSEGSFSLHKWHSNVCEACKFKYAGHRRGGDVQQKLSGKQSERNDSSHSMGSGWRHAIDWPQFIFRDGEAIDKEDDDPGNKQYLWHTRMECTRHHYCQIDFQQGVSSLITLGPGGAKRASEEVGGMSQCRAKRTDHHCSAMCLHGTMQPLQDSCFFQMQAR